MSSRFFKWYIRASFLLMTNSKISCEKQTLAGYFFQLSLYLLRDLGNHYPDHFIFQDLDDWIGHFTKEGRHLEFLHTILIEINCPLPITHVCTVWFLSICSSTTYFGKKNIIFQSSFNPSIKILFEIITRFILVRVSKRFYT